MGSFSQKELEQEVKDAGNRLLRPPSSIHELLHLLDQVELLLFKVEQSPTRSMQDALLPLMKALIANELLRHSDTYVQVSVVSCINEVIRITAPDAPYSDEDMKEIFQLTVMALENLSHVSGSCYTKALSILETIAKFRSCLVMLDLECDELIVEMFQQFLRSIRCNHHDTVFSDMETIMTLVVNESEEISMELLRPLLTSLKKENQNVSPLSWKLAEKVMKNCSAKLKPYLQEAMNSMGTAFNDYAEVVASICQDAIEGEALENAEKLLEMKDSDEPNQVVKAHALEAVCPGERMMNDDDKECIDARTDHQAENLESVKAVRSESEAEAPPKKRGWRPNSLLKPEEGYSHSWISSPRKSFKLPHQKTKICTSSSENPASKRTALRPNRAKEANPQAFSPKTSQGALDLLNVQAEERVSRSTDVTLIKEVENTIDFKAKYERASSKTKEVSSDPEGKQVSSAQKIDGKKRSKGKTVFEKYVNEASGDKRKVSLSVTKSLPKDASHRDSGTTRKRKHTPQMEEDPELPQGVKEYGEELVGCKINVWWPMDQVFYEGTIDSFDTLTKKHRVLYAYGDEEILTLSMERWELVENNILPDRRKVSLSATKSLSKVESHLDKASRTTWKGKRTPQKEEDAELPHDVKEYGEELVGSKINVWWPMDQMFFEGIVDSFDPLIKKHRVLYADGDEEILTLSMERWELVGK